MFSERTFKIDSSICLILSFCETIPKTSFKELLANLDILTNSLIKIAPNAMAAGPVNTLPIPLTNPFAKVLPSSSPPPSKFLMPSTLSFTNDKKSPISGVNISLPITSASSCIEVAVWLAIAAIVLFNISFLSAA